MTVDSLEQNVTKGREQSTWLKACNWARLFGPSMNMADMQS